MINIADTIRDVSKLTADNARDKLVKDLYFHIRKTLHDKALIAIANGYKEVYYDITHLAPSNLEYQKNKAKAFKKYLQKHTLFNYIVEEAEKAGATVDVYLVPVAYRLVFILPVNP